MNPKFLILSTLLSVACVASAEPPEWSGSPDYSIEIKTLLGQMKYNIPEFEVEPGARIKLTLNNDDDLQHNLIVLGVDPKDKDGFQFATEVWLLGEKGLELGWVPPDSKRVIAASKLLDPHAKEDIYFQLPEVPGDYPFVCTVPGHTLTMKGKIKVRPNKQLLTGLKYAVYKGSWKKLPDFSSLKPESEGELPKGLIDLDVAKVKGSFGMVFHGQLEIPKTADYEFEFASDDGGQLIVDGENEIIDDGIHPARVKKKKLKLEEGLHTIEVRYFEGGGQKALSLAVKSGAIGGKIALSSKVIGGGRNAPKAAPTPIPLLPENPGEAVMYRNFIDGSNPRGIAVGYPGGVNICWDADLLNVVMIWRGGFMDASRHWNGRGQGNQPPAGFDVGKPAVGFPLQVIESSEEPWQKEFKGDFKYDKDNPVSKSEKKYVENHPDYKFIGYRLDEKRFPTFRYEFQKLKVEDRSAPKESEAGIEGIERMIVITGSAAAGTHFRIAENGTLGEDGWFDTGGPTKIKCKGAIVREWGDKRELVVPISGETTITVQYSWKTKIGGKVSAN
ncbi:MAG: azurin [Verrucomicrobiales bacterium]|jgi:azurin